MMKYEYTVVYRIKGIEHDSPEDLELIVSENGQIRAILTNTPDKYDDSANDKAALLTNFADWCQQHNAQLLVKPCRNAATTPRPKCEDAPHVVIQISGNKPDLGGSEIIETDDYVVHLNPNDPSDLIRTEGEGVIAAILVSLVLEAGGTITLKKIWDSIVMTRGDGKRTIPANFSTTVKINIFDSLANDATTRITDCYRKFSSGKKELNTVLRLLTLSFETEDDKLRSFLFSWSALEVFVNKIFKKYKTDLSAKCGDDSAMCHAPIECVCDVPENEEDKSFVKKFKTIAAQLCIANANEDVDKFRNAKKTRDNLLHGSYIDEKTLPVKAVRELLIKYLQLHLGKEPRPPTDKTTSVSGRYDPSRKK